MLNSTNNLDLALSLIGGLIMRVVTGLKYLVEPLTKVRWVGPTLGTISEYFMLRCVGYRWLSVHQEYLTCRGFGLGLGLFLAWD
jgi:hypothetical protein